MAATLRIGQLGHLLRHHSSRVTQRALMSTAKKDVDGPLNHDEAIHTGQAWSSDDVRNVRFLNHSKQTNRRWAIDLIDKTDIIYTDQHVVACDGGGGALGHPRVYINLDGGEAVACIYCGQRYQLKAKREEEEQQQQQQ